MQGVANFVYSLSGRRRSAILFIMAAAMTAVWLAAAFAHLQNPYAFFRLILGYQILPTRWAALTAAILPWWQIILGLALLSPRWRMSAAVGSVATGVVFLVALATAGLRGLDISCGCFGVGGARIGWASAAPAAFLSVAGVVVAMMAKRSHP